MILWNHKIDNNFHPFLSRLYETWEYLTNGRPENRSSAFLHAQLNFKCTLLNKDQNQKGIRKCDKFKNDVSENFSKFSHYQETIRVVTPPHLDNGKRGGNFDLWDNCNHLWLFPCIVKICYYINQEGTVLILDQWAILYDPFQSRNMPRPFCAKFPWGEYITCTNQLGKAIGQYKFLPNRHLQEMSRVYMLWIWQQIES